jgi:chemotaxis protein methyltransferase CheR
MTLRAAMPDLDAWDARILATDIDTNMVSHGAAGRYAADRVEPVPAEYRRDHLRRLDNGQVEMSPALKALIAFRQLNLLEAWPMSGPFDAVFCRNVVIYFDKSTQRSLFDRFASLLVPGGHLYVGHSESLFRVCDRFEHLGRTIYRKCR